MVRGDQVFCYNGWSGGTKYSAIWMVLGAKYSAIWMVLGAKYSAIMDGPVCQVFCCNGWSGVPSILL